MLSATTQCTLDYALLHLAYGHSPYQKCHRQIRQQAADFPLSLLALLIAIEHYTYSLSSKTPR